MALILTGVLIGFLYICIQHLNNRTLNKKAHDYIKVVKWAITDMDGKIKDEYMSDNTKAVIFINHLKFIQAFWRKKYREALYKAVNTSTPTETKNILKKIIAKNIAVYDLIDPLFSADEQETLAKLPHIKNKCRRLFDSHEDMMLHLSLLIDWNYHKFEKFEFYNRYIHED